MKEYRQSSVLRPVFDCLRVQTEQLFCPQRRCRTFCLGRVPEYTPFGKKLCALLRSKLAYSIHPRQQQQHRCACAAFRERKRKTQRTLKSFSVTLPKAHEPDKKLAGPGVAAPGKKFMRLPCAHRAPLAHKRKTLPQGHKGCRQGLKAAGRIIYMQATRSAPLDFNLQPMCL